MPSQELLKSIGAFVIIAVVGIAAQYAVAQAGVVDRIYKNTGNTVPTSPTIQTLDLGLIDTTFYLNSSTGRRGPALSSPSYPNTDKYVGSTLNDAQKANLRLSGMAIFENLIADNSGSGQEPNIFSHDGTKLYVGYDGDPDNPSGTNADLADLQVDGPITVSSLAGTGSRRLCVDDFGILYPEPSTGYCDGGGSSSSSGDVVNGSCESWTEEYYEQPAYNDGTGCLAGTYSDTSDSTTEFKWECQGIGTGATTASCSADIMGGICNEYVTPQQTKPSTCKRGTYTSGTDTADEWRWTCSNTAGTDSCSAKRSCNPVWVDGTSFNWKAGTSNYYTTNKTTVSNTNAYTDACNGYHLDKSTGNEIWYKYECVGAGSPNSDVPGMETKNLINTIGTVRTDSAGNPLNSPHNVPTYETIGTIGNWVGSNTSGWSRFVPVASACEI